MVPSRLSSTSSSGSYASSRSDAPLIALALLHGAMLTAWPTLPVLALGLWWNSNTVAHNFLHRPFFRARAANLLFSAYLSLLLGIPQTLWRERHLAHHAGVAWKLRVSVRLAVETALVLALWIALAAFAPHFFLFTYLPGYLLGLALCSVQGHYEHARGIVSHYGSIYNFLCLNDGYHAEHHARPGAHWSTLPARRVPGASASRWPAPLRWLDELGLDELGLEGLERLVLRSPRLRTFVLRAHARALQPLLQAVPSPASVAIVGGGLFPRTALLLQQLLPAASLTIIDAEAEHLSIARALLPAPAGAVEFLHARYPACDLHGYDLVIIPLSFDGDRAAIERDPPSPSVLIHDWIWRRRGRSRVVSWALLKRINLIRR